MAVSVKYITWTKPVTGTPPFDDLESASLGFTPKGIIQFHANASSTSFAEGYGTGFGFSDGTTHQCVASNSDDNAATSNAGHCWQASFIAICSSTSGTVLDEATVRFGADTFTLTWTTRSANPATIYMLVFGDTDITDVKVGNFGCANATGAQTTTGTSFTPDCELYIPSNASTADENGNQGYHGMGAARTSSEEWSCYFQTADNQTTNSITNRYQTTTNCIVRGNNSTGGRGYLCDFTAFTSTGRTMNVSDADTTTTQLQHFMSIGGGSHSIGTFTVPAGTGNFDAVTGLSFTPKAILLVSTGGSTNLTGTTSDAQSRYAVGMALGTGQMACVSAHDTHGAATSICTKVNQTTRCLRLHTAAATAASSVIEVDLSWVSMNSDGFTLNRNTNTTTLGNELVHYWAIGDSAAAANNVVRAVPTETVTLSDSRTRLAAKIRTRTDTAITISENRARLAAKMRPISTQTTTLSENVIRVKGKVKTLATETITVTGGTLARLLAKIRTGTDTTAIVENRARLAAKNRTLATQTITIGAGTIARLKAVLRIATDTTTISESRQRLGSKSRPLSTQTVAIGESLQRLKAVIKTLATQTVALSESISRIKGVIRTMATQTVTIGGGTLARLSAKIRVLGTQTVVLTEDLQRTLTAGAQNIVKTITQTITLGESIARLKTSQRLTSQTIIIGAGSIARLSNKIRAIPQTIILVDNRARLSAKLRALAIQTITLTDNRARTKGAVKAISQTTIISESITRRLAKIRALSLQTVALADSVARQIIGGPVEIIRSLTQSVVLSDSLGRRLTVQRILTQTVPRAESLVRVRGVLKSLLQTIPVSGSPSRIKSAFRTLSQTVAASENLTRLNTIRRTISQTTILAENVIAETVGNLVRSLVETITVSDNIVRRTAKLVILDQFVVIAEQASRISAKLRTIPAQTITLTDSTTQEINVIIKHAIRTLSQVIAITDYAKIEVVKKSQRFRKILDPSIKRLISNHPAWLLGTRGQHDHYEEFSP